MLKNYVITAFRNLRRNKVYSGINIFGLAAGTLCCMYILLYIQDEYSYDRQHKDPADIYRLTTIWTVQGDKGNWATVTAPVAPTLKKDLPEVMQYARMVPALGIDHHLLRFKDKSIYEDKAVFADSTLFEIFNFHFVNGNEKKALATPYSVVLMQPLAAKLFGNDDPIGKIIQVDNAYGKNDFTVTGVIDESLGKSHIQAGMFMSMNSGGIGSFVAHDNSWAGNNIAISYIRLNHNANAAEIEKKLPALLGKYGGEQLKNLGMTKELHLQPLRSIHTSPGFRGIELSKPVSPSFLYILLIIAIIIQLIACINFMNLSTARASVRAREVGVRKVIGASRGNLVKQFLYESFLLAIIGVLLAVPLLVWLLPALNQLTGATISTSFLTDPLIWLMLGALVAITGLIAGSYPAFYLSAFQAAKVIKGNFTNHVSASGIRKSLVVFQFSLSIILVSAIVIIYSQLNYIKNRDLGFDKAQKLVFSFHSAAAIDRVPAFLTELRGIAGVEVASCASNSPGLPVIYDLHLYANGGNIATAPDASLIHADEYFMKAAGLKLASGRDFRTGDENRIIINEQLMKALNLELEKAPGTVLHSQLGNGDLINLEIAGVMKDYNYSSLRETVKPLFIWYTSGGGDRVVVNTRTNNYKSLLGSISSLWRKNFSGIPFEYSFIDQEVQKQYEAEITLSGIINSFTVMALLISCLGLWGLASFSAERRNKEIGIRKVLGASVPELAGLLSVEFVKLVLISFIIAAPLSWWAMNKWLDDFAYRVTISWWMFAVSGLIAILIAVITVSFQSIRTAMSNPIKSLRAE